MKIPFVDLSLINKPFEKEFIHHLKRIIDKSEYIKGSYHSKLETLIKKTFKSKFCILVNSGTDALIISIKSLKLKEGDEVITTANTWISSAYAIVLNGATPVFCDINPEDYQINIDDLKKKISLKTKAIIVTHLYGCPNNMDEIKKIIKNKKIYLIEDLAQSHLAKYKNKLVGNFGKMSILSFYPSKNLGALGDGGAILTNSSSLYKFCTMFANYGAINFKDPNKKIIGINSRLDEIQASFLYEKLKKLKKDTKKRNQLAKIFDKKCKILDIKNIQVSKGSFCVYHLYPIEIENRDLVIKQLKKKEIYAQIHYKIPIHLQDSFKYLGYEKNSLPITESVSRKLLSLPFYPGMNKKKINYLFNNLKNII